MKLTFPKIVHKVDLDEYDEAMKGQAVFVHVNPPSETLIEMGELFKEKDKPDEYLRLMSDLLSQGKKDTHITVKDLQELIDATKDTDPRFWVWLQVRVIGEINEHRLGLKKA